MLWQNRQESSNVEDRRGISGGGLVAGGGIIGVIVLLINFFMGDGDISQLPQVLNNSAPQQQQQMSPQAEAADNERAKFVKVTLHETEIVWQKLMSQNGSSYPPPTLVLFRNSVNSGCGGASAESGPFY
ncbi:MAG: neutral zinc metallopeptidase, partial [Chitinophagaceae bacterium]